MESPEPIRPATETEVETEFDSNFESPPEVDADEPIAPDENAFHDVIVQSITALGGVVQDVLFNDLRDFTYYAKVRIQHRSGLVELDVRPSDALNVAVIAGVPVFIAERILGV